MEDQKPEETKIPQQPKMREIIIQTDGNIAKITKAEVVGSLELKAILLGLVESIK